MQMPEIFSSTQVTASPSFECLTASSLNCCFFCTSLLWLLVLMMMFSQQGNLTSLFPDFCKHPFSVWQRQAGNIKERRPKALTKPIPLAKVNAIQHHFERHSGEKSSSFQAALVPFSIIKVVSNFIKTEFGGYLRIAAKPLPFWNSKVPHIPLIPFRRKMRNSAQNTGLQSSSRQPSLRLTF